jgi:hypothetical protein
MDEAKLGRDVSRASQAQSLLENELFNEAITTLKRELMDAWEATQPRDVDGRERCWAAVQQVGRLKSYLQSVLNDGKLANAELKELTERQKRFGIV